MLAEHLCAQTHCKRHGASGRLGGYERDLRLVHHPDCSLEKRAVHRMCNMHFKKTMNRC